MVTSLLGDAIGISMNQRDGLPPVPFSLSWLLTWLSLACLPDFLTRPLPGPFERDEGVAGHCPRVGPELDEVCDLQAAAPQQPDHVAVAEVKLHRLIIWPF